VFGLLAEQVRPLSQPSLANVLLGLAHIRALLAAVGLVVPLVREALTLVRQVLTLLGLGLARDPARVRPDGSGLTCPCPTVAVVRGGQGSLGARGREHALSGHVATLPACPRVRQGPSTGSHVGTCESGVGRGASVGAVDLAEIDRIGARDHYLAVVTTTRADGSMQASVVNAGVVDHPVTGERNVAFVTYGRTKLAHLRARPRATAVFRAGWQWGAVDRVMAEDRRAVVLIRPERVYSNRA